MSLAPFRPRSVLFALLVLLVFGPGAHAASDRSIPTALEPWIGWVLDGDDRRACPINPRAAGDSVEPGADEEGRICAWPGRLYLDLDDDGGLFAQGWHVYGESWVPLPGDPEVWPQDTRSSDSPLPVVLHDGFPAAKLPPGDHVITGRFQWQHPPEGLNLPPQNVLLSLVLDGMAVQAPRVEQGGRLWIGDTAGAAGGAEDSADALGIQVFRQVEDDLPLRVTTRLELDVSGKARLVTIGPVLLPGSIPLRIQSPLPSRLDRDGRLRLQVRPGSWVVELEAHRPGPVTALSRDESAPPWPEVEVWSFAARPGMRQAEVVGVAAVDPRQSGVPADWSRLPAYRVELGETLSLEVRRRGNPDPGPDRLDLTRDLWLDFDGRGYSVQDGMIGQLTRSWRLELGAPLELGQVRVDGEPRLITRLGADDPPGVEVRRGRLQLVADSRLDGNISRPPVSGWGLEIQSIRARLHLPPGWDLLGVSGVDNLPHSWLGRWTLLDLFLVLIAALGVSRLMGRRWGLIALLGLALTWKLPNAPQFIWLHLLAGATLLRLLLPGRLGAGMTRLRVLVCWYFRLSLVVLLLVGLPFVAGQVRIGVWPQLERPSVQMGGITPKTHAEPGFQPAPAAGVGQSLDAVARGRAEGALRKSIAAPTPLVDPADPGARVQSGPGIPRWGWSDFDLSWNGPVQPDETVRLWLLTPFWHLAWAWVGALLLAALAVRFALVLKHPPTDGTGSVELAPGTVGPLPAQEETRDMSRLSLSLGSRFTPLALLVLCPLLVLPQPRPASAEELPRTELLDALKTRLLKPPDCLPDCAELAALSLQADADWMRLVLTLDVAAHVAVPVPGGPGGWLPTSLIHDGVPLDAVRRGLGDQILVALTPGRHLLELSGPLPDRTQVEIPFPLHPRQTSVDVEGWSLEGLDAAGHPGAQIRLLRLSGHRGEEADPPSQGELPPLLMVERVLVLGLDWRLQTRVRRLSPAEFPVVLPVPLLEGESVQTPGVSIQGGRILVNLLPGETDMAWVSSVAPKETLGLTAVSDPRLAESWTLDVTPRWHLSWSGIPPIQQVSTGDRMLPLWRPLPGETLTLTINRPQPVFGPTLTLERVDWTLRPGRRASESELTVEMRSTQGGTHAITLPRDAVPVLLRIDAQERPLPAAGGSLEIPLVPGHQEVKVQWREPHPLGLRLRPDGPDLGASAVNLTLAVEMPAERWVLFATGPRMGPVVTFWGILLVLIGVSLALARVCGTPLSASDWLLLGIGLALAQIWVALLVVGWLLVLQWRRGLDESIPRWRYNLIQIMVIALTLVALAGLLSAVSQGLLGHPQMQIMGNGSSGGQLNWYLDRGGPLLPQVTVYSVPMWVYRVLMLAWALWLASRLLEWLRWGWEGLCTPTLWREMSLGGLRGLRRKPSNPG